ncbi:ribonuclease E/G [Soehngenia longivitae]|uniref:Ribonuclease E/G n=1 Tax=Soehngenia longivitae TaxID=2562294 RepID=A0A4Z0D5P8_9FIRM|nr:ribonuclease E/G [Soehngenia longivitae]TFZ40023.1 ribonuclease E/G [Soehngenia longivitae]
MNRIYFDITSEKKTISIVENNRLVEYYEEKNLSQSKIGNIYRARVDRVLPSLNAAFVDIGDEKNAYLSFEEIPNTHMILKTNPIKSGDIVLVQVVKDQMGSKGAKVTMKLTLAGKYIIYSPYKTGIKMSKKLNDNDKQYLREIAEQSFSANDGIIFRTNASNAKKEYILNEYYALKGIYDKILKEVNYLPTPKLIYQASSVIDKILRDYFKPNENFIIVNDKDFYYSIINKLDDDNNLKENIILDLEFSSRLDTLITHDLRQAMSNKVPLKSGGYIVIDELEALTAIDVNTGSLVTGRSYQEIVLKTNIEAAKEIAIQLRLRNIGGIIIVDFIDMISLDDVDILKKTLEEEFKKDKNNPTLVDITKLNLYEIVREKNVISLKNRVISKNCP